MNKDLIKVYLKEDDLTEYWTRDQFYCYLIHQVENAVMFSDFVYRGGLDKFGHNDEFICIDPREGVQ